MGKEQRGQITPDVLKALERIHDDIAKDKTDPSQQAISAYSEPQIRARKATPLFDVVEGKNHYK